MKKGVDLASFANTDDFETIKDITLGMSGALLRLQKHGIKLFEEDIKRMLKLKGVYKNVTPELYKQQRLITAFRIITEATIDSLDDAERTSASVTNQWKGMRAAMTEASNAMGDELKPVTLSLIQTVTRLFESLKDTDKETKRVIIALLGFAAAIGPVLLGLAGIGVVLLTVSPAIIGVATALTALAATFYVFQDLSKGLNIAMAALAAFLVLLLPLGATVAAVAAAVVAMGAAYYGYKEQIDGAIRATADFTIGILESTGAIDAARVVVRLVARSVEILVGAFTQLFALLPSMGGLKEALQELHEGLASSFDGLTSSISEFIAESKSKIQGMWDSFSQSAESVKEKMTEAISGGVGAGLALGKDAFSRFSLEVEAIVQTLRGKVETGIAGIITDITRGGSLLDSLRGLGENLGLSIADWAGTYAAGGTQKRAMGGNVAGGAPYVVGENGPELFIPAGGGRILPQGRGGMGGAVINLTMHFGAGSDAQGVRESLPQIQKALLDAVRKGQSLA